MISRSTFSTADKRASDAVIWLRNAGGKSSRLLNLFFALMRPGRLKLSRRNRFDGKGGSITARLRLGW